MPSSSCTQFVGFKKRCHDNCRECPALDVHDLLTLNHYHVVATQLSRVPSSRCARFLKCRIKALLLSATFSAIVLYGKILNNTISYSILQGIIYNNNVYFKDQLKITKPRHFTLIFSKGF